MFFCKLPTTYIRLNNNYSKLHGTGCLQERIRAWFQSRT